MLAICWIIGLVIGNFTWQAVAGPDWSVALERSFFQAIAVGVYALIAR